MKKAIIQNLFLSFIIITIANITIVANISDEKKEQLIFPIVPLIAEYEYTPFYFSQRFKEDEKYKMIEAMFDPKDPNSLEVVMMEKDGKRTYYSGSEKNVNQRKVSGLEAYLTKISFKMPKDETEQQIYGIGFADKYKQPIIWRVSPTSKPSKYGEGLRDIPWKNNLYLEYVDLGSTIGAATAIKIGENVIEAEPWSEISSPPYFYAYKGSFSVGRHLGIFFEGNEDWKLLYAPKEIKDGDVWKFSNGKGRYRVLQIASQKGDSFTLNELPAANFNFPLKSMEITNSTQGLAMNSMHLNHNSHKMQIEFKPALPLEADKLVGFKADFTITRGEDKKIVKGDIIGELQDGKSVKLMWIPKSPKHVKSKSMEAVIDVHDKGYSIATKTIDKQNRGK